MAGDQSIARENFKRLAALRGWTAKEIDVKIGISEGALYNWTLKSSPTNLGSGSLVRLARLFNIEPEDFLGTEGLAGHHPAATLDPHSHGNARPIADGVSDPDPGADADVRALMDAGPAANGHQPSAAQPTGPSTAPNSHSRAAVGASGELREGASDLKGRLPRLASDQGQPGQPEHRHVDLSHAWRRLLRGHGSGGVLFHGGRCTGSRISEGGEVGLF